MTDFLLELRSEEIPARMQVKAKADLERLFVEALAKAGLMADSIETFATPRRLALIAHGLPLSTEAVSEETKGPKVGAPPQALEGFTRKLGLSVDQLTERDGVYFAVIEKAGRATADVLAEAIPGIVRAFPWPKSMRWGAASLSTESLRWVRPLQGIVALLGDTLVPCEVDGIVSGRETMGHRFHSSGPVSIANPGAYVEALRAAHVIIHFSERCRIIREGAAKAAADAGLVIVEDEALVIENAGLTEWPVPLLGRFDPAFLNVPPEVIQLTARVNQKYFVCHDASGALTNAFVCTANIDAHDGGAAIIAGNEKVLAARLADAKFFWEADLKVTYEELEDRLYRITFFENVGNYAEKKTRLELLSDEFSHYLGERNSRLADRLGHLAKFDLVSQTVGEFPELQGIVMGRLIDAHQAVTGEAQIGAPLSKLYHSAAQISDGPSDPVANFLQLIDRLDHVVSLAAGGAWFTGSKDPYAIRQAAIAAIAAWMKLGLRSGLRELIRKTYLNVVYSLAMSRNVYVRERFRSGSGEELERDNLILGPSTDGTQPSDFLKHGYVLVAKNLTSQQVSELRDHTEIGLATFKHYSSEETITLLPFPQIERKLIDLFIDRLKVQQREAGVRHDLIDAVFALGGEDDLVRLLARVKALQGFFGTAEGADLLAAYKRAANILKSSPERGGGSRSDTEGPGSAAATAPTDPSTASGGPPPRSGEDLVDAALLTALDAAEPLATAAIAAEDFEAAMAALATLRAPIDAFFAGVMVNDPDPAIRAARQALLARFRDAVHQVADFSKIEG